jgi:uncharacterized membrane protein
MTAQSAVQRRTIMATFTINEQNEIVAFSTRKKPLPPPNTLRQLHQRAAIGGTGRILACRAAGRHLEQPAWCGGIQEAPRNQGG